MDSSAIAAGWKKSERDSAAEIRKEISAEGRRQEMSLWHRLMMLLDAPSSVKANRHDWGPKSADSLSAYLVSAY